MALQRAGFASIEFPIEKCSIVGGLRDHVHEYPHSPGGAPEKLGRKLYEIRMSALFFNSFGAYGARLWPSDLAKLRNFWEIETTEDLVIPTIGTIQAYAISWTQEQTNKASNGERVEMVFREDQASAFLASALVSPSASSLQTNAKTLISMSDPLDLGTDVFGAIQGLVNDVTAIGDQIQLQGDIFSAKLEGICSICSELDRSFGPLAKPENWPVIGALHNVWDSAQTLQQDTLRKSKPIIKYRVPKTMSVADISRAVYGDNKHAVDILRMNPIEDAFRVPTGKILRVYAP